MKVKLSTEICDLEGHPLWDEELKDPTGKVVRARRPFTVRKACTEALQIMNLQGDIIDGEEKMLRYRLAFKLMSADVVDLKAEEITKLKRLVGLAFGATVVGPVYLALDPDPSSNEEPKP